MARFDVYKSRSAKHYLLDCQADLLSHFATRLVVPLVPDGIAETTTRLHPVFTIDGKRLIMATQLASAVDVREMGERVASLSEHHDLIMNALDMLISGF